MSIVQFTNNSSTINTEQLVVKEYNTAAIWQQTTIYTQQLQQLQQFVQQQFIRVQVYHTSVQFRHVQFNNSGNNSYTIQQFRQQFIQQCTQQFKPLPHTYQATPDDQIS